MGAGTSIIVCGQKYDVGQRVITFEDDPAINAYTPHRTDKPLGSAAVRSRPRAWPASRDRWRPRRLIGADRSIDRLQQVVRQFVVHHDGCQDSRMCFHVLHNERGLSVHFLIDNDGTIYQTLDLVDCAFHAAGVNEISVGVELANRGDAHALSQRLSRQARQGDLQDQRPPVPRLRLHARRRSTSMISIGKTLARIFPNLPQVYPARRRRRASRGTRCAATCASIPGYLGHYHVTDQKWDPGPFDFKFFASKIRGRMCLSRRHRARRQARRRPTIRTRPRIWRNAVLRQ